MDEVVEELIKQEKEVRAEAKEEASQPTPVKEVEKLEIPREVFTQKLLDELECGVNPHKLMCLEKSNETYNTSAHTPHTDR